jgi:cytochrome oxidase Cu insertion factor (SCO1/SenC/PrrC family)
LFYSSGYVNEVYNVLFIDYEGLKFSKQIDTGLIKKYDYLNSRLPSTLGIPVITLFLDHDIDNLKLNTNIESIEKIIERTYHQKDSVYKTYVENRLREATSFKKGMDAPDFIVENQRGEKVTLSSFKGKVIYLDFWYAACGPCHALFETLEPLKKDYSKGKDVVFLTVSIDRREVWEKALKKYSIDGYHVFTENREGSHPIIKAYKVAGYPSTYLIDRNGKIFLANPSKNPEQLNKEIAEALATPATNR